MNDGDELVAETCRINLYSEYSLHDQLKRRAAGPGGRIEVCIEGKIADALRPDGEIVEIQSGALSALLDKAGFWSGRGYRQRIQIPLAGQKIIVKIRQNSGEIISRRRSPKKEELWSVFDRLVRASSLLSLPGLVIELVYIEMEEIRTVLEEPVRRGRFLKSYATVDRNLVAVRESREFASPADWLALLPENKDGYWTSTSLGKAAGIGSARARKLLYTFSRAGIIEQIPSEDRAKRYSSAGKCCLG
jgi:hypothetical protein